jgi:glutamate/aspartate transport system permease protein
MNHFDFSVIVGALPYLGKGLLFSLELTAIAFLGGLVLGTGMAIVRQSRMPLLARAINGYVTLMRSIPLILVLFWCFFLIPLALGWLASSGHPIPLGQHFTAFVTFTLFEAAYFSEIIRAGLNAIPPGQYQAARALGLRDSAMYRTVIIPQVLRATAPVIVSQVINLFQDTALVYVISLTDFLGAASQIAQRDSRIVEMYTTVAVVYLVLCSLGAELAEYLRRKMRVGSVNPG